MAIGFGVLAALLIVVALILPGSMSGVAWAIFALGGVIGVVAIVLFVRRHRRPAAPAPAQPEPEDQPADSQQGAGAERPRRLAWLWGMGIIGVGLLVWVLATNIRLDRFNGRLTDLDRKVAVVDSSRTATQAQLGIVDSWARGAWDSLRVLAQENSALKAELAVEVETRQKIDGDLNRRVTSIEGKGGKTAAKATTKKAVRKTRPAAQKSQPSVPKPPAMTAEDVKKIATEAAVVAVDTLLARRLEPVNASLRAMASALAEIGSREVITGIVTAKKGKKVVAVKSDCLLSEEAVQALRDISK